MLIMGFAPLMWCNAQSNEEEATADGKLAYEPGKIYLNAGFTLLSRSLGPRLGAAWAGYNYNSTIPFIVSGEYGYNEAFSFGGFAGYRSYGWDYRIGDGRYEASHNRTAFGVRASYHYLPLLNDNFDFGADLEKFDFYVTLLLGMNITSARTVIPERTTTETDVGGIFGPIFGFRYMLNHNIGVYAEGGYGSMGYGNLGVSLKF